MSGPVGEEGVVMDAAIQQADSAQATDEPLSRRAARVFQAEGLRSFGRKSWYYVKARFLYAPFCARKIRSLGSEVSLERLVDVAMAGCWEIIKPAQAREEILKLLVFLEPRRPSTILEIGTARGGTLFLFSRIAADNALLMSVDLPGGQFLGGYPRWKSSLYRSFARADQRIRLIRADSHLEQTAQEVTRALEGRAVDFLFIDGDHTSEGVAKDFAMYSPLVRKGGIIAFHDIVDGSPDVAGGVSTFWRQIKARYDHREIVNDWNQGRAGIGIVVW